jgi:hypothetical protein
MAVKQEEVVQAGQTEEQDVTELSRHFLPDWLYQTLKWVALLALPTCAWGYQALAEVWGFPYVSQIPFTLNVCGTVLAVLIGASTLKGLSRGK